MSYFLDLLQCLSGGVSVPIVTNAQAKRVGMNVAGANSYEYGHTYLDWTRRFDQPFYDGTAVGGTTPATLKANGSPAASYHYLLQANALAADIGVYNCWMPGTCDPPGTGTGLQMYYGGAQQVGAFSNFAYDSPNDRTTFTLTVSGTTGPMIVVSNPSATAGYIRIIPAAYDRFANADDFHPDLIARLTTFGVSSIRGMDWFDTNNAAVVDTNWAGSVMAGGDGSIRGMSRSLSEFIRLANVLGANIHVAFPRGATADLYANAFALIGANLPTNKTCTIEMSDEPWNSFLATNLYYMKALLPLAGTYTGLATAGPTILSVVRASNVVTITLSSAPGAITSCVLVGVTNITGGLIDAGKGINVVGSTITYNETGADVTGTITTNNYNTYLHTNPTHYLDKALTTYGAPTSNFGVVTPYTMCYRYNVELLRAVWTQVQSLSDKARYRFMISVQPGSNEFTIFPYARERFGDDTWINADCMPAPYFSATVAGKTTPQILTSLAAGAVSRCKGLIQEANAAATYGHTMSYYEGGPALNGGTSSDTAAIGAANLDPACGATLTQMLGYQRDLGLSGVFQYFKDGCSLNYATHMEGSDNEQCWNIVDQSNTDLTKPKPLALINWAAANSAPQPFTAVLHPEVGVDLTWGSINFLDVCGMLGIGSSSGGSLVFSNTVVLPDGITILLTPPAGKTSATLSLYIAGAAGTPTDWVTATLNGVTIANQTVLSTGYPTPSTPCVTQVVTTIPGQFNPLKLTFKPASRQQFMALLKITLT